MTTQRIWTDASRYCYKRGCVCKDCFYTDFFKDSDTKCRMKNSVMELVRRFGRPLDVVREIIFGD